MHIFGVSFKYFYNLRRTQIRDMDVHEWYTTLLNIHTYNQWIYSTCETQNFQRTQSAQRTWKIHKTMNLEKCDRTNAFLNKPWIARNWQCYGRCLETSSKLSGRQNGNSVHQLTSADLRSTQFFKRWSKNVRWLIREHKYGGKAPSKW